MEERPLKPTSDTQETLHPVHPEITEYLHQLYPLKDDVLKKMEELARKRSFPIVGRHSGHFLKVMAMSTGAKRIFEFGSGFGYSAYWFASGMPEEGKVICSDADNENFIEAKKFLQEANLWEKIDYRVGMAQEVFSETEGEFDIIYNDVDKGYYPEVWNLAKKRLRPGGLYIADNTLWHGRVTQETIKNDVKPGWTEAIKDHNQQIVSDNDFESFLNPIRDGLLTAIKTRSKA